MDLPVIHCPKSTKKIPPNIGKISKTLPQPDSEKAVVYLIHALFLHDKIFFEQATQSRLHGAWGGLTVFPDKFAGSDGTGLAFLSQSNRYI